MATALGKEKVGCAALPKVSRRGLVWAAPAEEAVSATDSAKTAIAATKSLMRRARKTVCRSVGPTDDAFA
jgi:phenylpropionate dioxygenase-like ring-hydroxylating dioxygenase large terminal subunit